MNDSTTTRLVHQLSDLIALHTLDGVVQALATACRWKSHHHAASNRWAASNQWARAAMSLDWVHHIHARELDQSEPEPGEAVDLHAKPPTHLSRAPGFHVEPGGFFVP